MQYLQLCHGKGCGPRYRSVIFIQTSREIKWKTVDIFLLAFLRRASLRKSLKINVAEGVTKLLQDIGVLPGSERECTEDEHDEEDDSQISDCHSVGIEKVGILGIESETDRVRVPVILESLNV